MVSFLVAALNKRQNYTTLFRRTIS